jgi:hypothetical protein
VEFALFQLLPLPKISRLGLEEVRKVVDTSICNLCSQPRHETQLAYELAHCPLQSNAKSCCFYPAHPLNWTTIIDSVQYGYQFVGLLLATHFALLRSRHRVWLSHRYIHDPLQIWQWVYWYNTSSSWRGTFGWFTFRRSAKVSLCTQIIAQLINKNTDLSEQNTVFWWPIRGRYVKNVQPLKQNTLDSNS